jgi:pimeloyl-ACP methyl ester carboxylesterase
MTPPRSSAVDSRLLRVHGLQIAIRVQGDGEPLLLINGMTRPLQSWDSFTQQLPGRTIVSFDAPGVGGSPTPLLPLSMPALAALAVAVLEAAGLNDADVLGYSHGGGVAQQLAGDAPGRVRRLVLVATSCGVGAIPGGGRAVLRGLGAPGEGNPPADAWGVVWQSLAFSSWSSVPFLGAIKAPTLVVCGTHDDVVPPANSRVLAGRIPGAKLVMLPGGHDLQRPEPAEALARAVDEFLPAWRDTERAPTAS